MLVKIKQQLREGKQLITFTTLTVMAQALGVVTPLVVAKLFSPGLFGSYTLARMVVFFVAALTISSAQQPFIVYANAERNKTGKINKSFSIQCVFLTISLCLYLVIITLFAGPVASFARISMGDLVFVSLAFAGFAIKIFVCNLFMALGRRSKGALAGLVYEAVTVIFIVLFYLADSINLRSVFLVYFLSGILLVIFFIWSLDVGLLFPFEFKTKYFKAMLSFTTWGMMGATSAYFINWGDNLVLRFFVSMNEIGIYNLSYSIFKGLIFLISAMGNYFLPFISQHIENKDKLHNYLAVKRPKIIALGLMGLVCVFFSIPHILKLLYGNVYSQSQLVLQILLIANAISLYSIFYSPLLSALKRYKFVNIIAVVQISINIILNLVFVPYLGMLGAAIATVIAYFCRAVIVEIYFRAYVNKKVNIFCKAS